MAVSSLSDSRFRIAFAGWWVVWAIMQSVILADFGFNLKIAVTDSIISNSILAACCLLISNNMQYYLPRQEKYWYVLFISLGLSAVWLLAVRVLLWLFFGQDNVYMNMVRQSSSLRYAIAFLMVSCMAMMSLTWYTQEEQKEANTRKTDAEKLAKDAELYKLRQQLQPHFLFNSLNSISALTGSQPEKARNMIQQLSDFLRGTLKKDELAWSTVEEELEYLQLYLEIEKVRFGYRLQTNIAYEDNVPQMRLPAMLLQPVVENAIKFGLYDTTGEVVITIKAKNENGVLKVNVQNPFDPDTSQSLYGTGFGLASIQRRLFLLFARHDLLTTHSSDKVFTTTVTIPQSI